MGGNKFTGEKLLDEKSNKFLDEENKYDISERESNCDQIRTSRINRMIMNYAEKIKNWSVFIRSILVLRKVRNLS